MGSTSRLRGGNQAKKACSFKVSISGSHAGPESAKTDSFLCPPPTATSGVVAGTGAMQAGAPVVSAPGMVPESFLPEPDDVKFDEGTVSLEPCMVFHVGCWGSFGSFSVGSCLCSPPGFSW